VYFIYPVGYNYVRIKESNYTYRLIMEDTHLIRLRYEILNISLADLATETQVPLPILEIEAKNNEWKQWWPEDQELQFQVRTSLKEASTPSIPLPILLSDQDDLTTDSTDDDGFDELSPLEEGAQLFIKDSRVRLQVFNLAKDIHLAHKYASFESALIDQAKGQVASAHTAVDVRNLVLSLKDLPGKAAAAGLQISQSDDGMPTVIIKDLSGRS